MTTFKRIKDSWARAVEKLAENYDLEEALVGNIFQYAKCLCKEGAQDIDHLIFMAQMSKYFNITNERMLMYMFEACKKPKTQILSVEQMASLICLFMSSKHESKVDFIFKCYDINGDHSISWLELYTLLKSAFESSAQDDDLGDEDAKDEATKDLIEIVKSLVDIDQNGVIDRTEFRRMVKHNVMFMELLGQCIPPDSAIERFRKKLEGKTMLQIRFLFEDERHLSLYEPKSKKKSSLYPVPLDLP